MKLQNKNTGQVDNFCIDKDQICSCDRAFVYDSLAQLQEAGWEDYEEPKPHFVSDFGDVYPVQGTAFDRKNIEKLKAIGNYFETEEEAEKAVEKLKAWKRLKDKGFKFTGITKLFDGDWNKITFNKDQDETWIKENKADLDLLFGGEE